MRAHPFGKALALLAVCAALSPACSPRVELEELDELHHSAPPRLESSGATLSSGQSRRILHALAREAGASEMLLRHLAIEEAYTDSPLVMGNRAQLLRDGDQAYPAMEQAMREARQHILLEIYTFREDEVGRRFAELMKARARDGVAVHLIYDSVGCMSTDPAFFEGLRSAGIHVVEFNPIAPDRGKGDWQVEQRDHRKLLVVDSRIAFTGGINISTEYSGGSSSGGSGISSSGSGPAPWRDTNIRIEGPVVAEFLRMFRDTWQKQHGSPRPWERYHRKVAAAGPHIVRAVGTTPDHEVSLIHTTLLSAIAGAQQSIYLTQMYFVPDEELLDAIRDAARRGVDVQIILPSEGFWMTRYAGRSHFSGLLAAGVRVYERTGPLLHAKTAVIDGVWSTVGSTNLDYRSLVKNDEINAVILGEDFAVELEAMFQDDVASSKEITRKAWRRRGPATRVKELAARLWERLL